jgi:serine/threonine protein kinase
MLGQLLDGRYLIEAELGVGGFGKTYKARDTRLPGQPTCVVKQLHQSSDPYLRLFEQEAEVLQKLGKHPQIPTLFAHFEQDKNFFLVQEFIDGGNLTSEFSQGRKWSEDEVKNLVEQVLSPLAAAHHEKIIHRDIKPANLVRRKVDGQIFLIDFGTVKQVSTTQVNYLKQNTTVGISSDGYSPIEQTLGKPHLGGSDVYALGIVALQALTGTIDARDLMDADAAQIRWRHLVTVNPAFANVLDKMVANAVVNRYQSAMDVINALNAISQNSSGVISSHAVGKSAGVAIAGGFGKPAKAPVKVSIKQKNTGATSNKSLRKTSIQQALSSDTILLGYKRISVHKKIFILFCGGISLLFLILFSSLYRISHPLTDDEKAVEKYIQDANEKIDIYTKSIQKSILVGVGYNHMNRGRIKYDIGDNNGAINDMTKAIESSYNTHPEAFCFRGVIRAELEYYQDGMSDINTSISQRAISSPDSVIKCYSSRGAIKHMFGDTKGAMKDYDASINNKFNDMAYAYLNRGLLHYELGDRKKALEDYNSSLQIDGSNPYIYNNLGMFKLESGDMKGAIEYYKRAIQIKVNFPDPYYGLCTAKYILNNKQEAIKDCKLSYDLYQRQNGRQERNKNYKKLLVKLKELGQ